MSFDKHFDPRVGENVVKILVAAAIAGLWFVVRTVPANKEAIDDLKVDLPTMNAELHAEIAELRSDIRDLPALISDVHKLQEQGRGARYTAKDGQHHQEWASEKFSVMGERVARLEAVK